MPNRHQQNQDVRPKLPQRTNLTPVRVRMFRQGLGDCFLLTFDPGGTARHVLIDCGSLGATTTGVDLADVVENIKQATGNHLDLVIATHEHWDHVSGFGSQRELFSGMEVNHVWMAWTENPKDDLAQKIEKYKGDLCLALATTHRALQAASAAGHERCTAAKALVEDVADFGGPGNLAAGTKNGLSANLDEAMQFVRTGLIEQAEYKVPGGEPLEPDWLPGFRIYFLGPPRNEARLRELGEHGSAELYGIASGLEVAAQVNAKAGVVESEDVEREMPCESRFRWPLGGAESLQWFPGYYATENNWRRVDGDWLNSAADVGEELAMQLDSLTNNTSLALAIERIADGKVLIFPADAQEGNWLSWHDPSMKWNVRTASGATADVTAEDLLGNTVFYKVGHHGSHNGTARSKGLELMPDTGLTAFIPVDRKVALTRSPKDSWQMPARPLYRRLLEKCEGRVVRSDIGWAVSPEHAQHPLVEEKFKGMATAREWTKWAEAQQAAVAANTVTIGKEYVDFMMV